MGETLRDGEFRLDKQTGQPYLQFGLHTADNQAAGTIKLTFAEAEQAFDVIGGQLVSSSSGETAQSISDGSSETPFVLAVTDHPKHPDGKTPLFWADTHLVLDSNNQINGKILLEPEAGKANGDFGWFHVGYVPPKSESLVELAIHGTSGSSAVSLSLKPDGLDDTFVILAIYNFTQTPKETNDPFGIKDVPNPRKCYVYIAAANMNDENHDPNVVHGISTIDLGSSFVSLEINPLEIIRLMAPNAPEQVIEQTYSLYYGTNRVKMIDSDEPTKTTLRDLGDNSDRLFNGVELQGETNKFVLQGGDVSVYSDVANEFPAGMYVFGEAENDFAVAV